MPEQSEPTLPRPAVDRLRDIEAVTDAALAHLDIEELLGTLLDRVREALHVDTAAVLLLETNNDFLVATAARGIEDEVVQGVRIPVGRGFAGKIAAEKHAAILDRVDHTTVMNPILRERGIQSMLGVPLLSAGDVLGVLHVGTLAKREFTPEDVMLLQLVADRIALATQARLSETDRAAAVALQHSLLPGRIPVVSGIEFAARYVPGEAEGVGGDWYDVFTLPTGALCVVMGDVVGRGLRAAVVMGRLRSTLRAYAITTSDPAEILTLVDRKLQHFEPGEMATALLAVLDLSADVMRISAAGHPAPLIASPDGQASFIDLEVDPPLGVRLTRARRSIESAIPRGSLLCLYTDGLVERRTVPLDDRLDLLRSAVRVESPESACASIMRALVGSDPPSDDIALLCVRLSDTGPGTPLLLELPAHPASLAQIRAALRNWLRGVGATEIAAYDLLVAVGEATANAVEHAYGSAAGTVVVEVHLDGADAVVRVKDNGQWREARGHGRGRGTHIMNTTTDEFHVERHQDGTEVFLRRRIDR
jgi:anti-sigma regulatory factor (Ser/Thr protein kinase)/putative methionine-R-sulfoxide reductase with GAF domain